jgi:RNA polymerase sigma-70 factor (ECF subfamily)
MRAHEHRALYEAMVREHSRELYRFAYRLCGSAAEAEDLVQESYTEAWKGLESLADPRKARAWLFQILRHRNSRAARTRSRRPAVVMAADGLAASGRAPDAHAEERDLIQRALDDLDERYKLPFLMVFMEGLTCQQAADQLGVPLGTVLSRIHRARQSMRSQLEHEAPRSLTSIEGGRA